MELLYKFKVAQSTIVATILMILLSVVAIALITSFIIPFVKEQLRESDCINYAGKIEIKQHPTYTCYNSTEGNMSVQIHIGDIEKIEEVTGFQIVINEGGSSKSFRVARDNPNSEIRMYNGSSSIVIPGKNEERAYKISGFSKKPETINVFLLLNNNQCDVQNSLTYVNNCQELTF